MPTQSIEFCGIRLEAYCVSLQPLPDVVDAVIGQRVEMVA